MYNEWQSESFCVQNHPNHRAFFQLWIGEHIVLLTSSFETLFFLFRTHHRRNSTTEMTLKYIRESCEGVIGTAWCFLTKWKSPWHPPWEQWQESAAWPLRRWHSKRQRLKRLPRKWTVASVSQRGWKASEVDSSQRVL